MWDPAQYLAFADHRSRPFYELLARVGAEEPRRVVDVGCGPADILRHIRVPIHYHGFDLSPSYIDAARAAHGDRGQFRCADITQLPIDEIPQYGGWGLTEAGKTEDARLVTAELAAAGTRDLVTGAFERFLVLNPELLDLCTAWHMRPADGVAELNDHTDAAYDSRVLARFADLDRRAAGVCTALETALPRFASYRRRLAAALARATAGEPEHLTDTTTSYHNVWFQLHEDLLVTLGIPR